ncbi:mitochondrial carrier domain-containing protein [Thamnidium elegans]|nr:mitochondrial carrier domain-containing protein [Thamnidium elegans]
MNMNSNSWNLRQLFGLFDQNQDGMIDVQDIVAVCSSPNAPLVDQATLRGIKYVVENNNEACHQPLAFSEFASLLDRHSIMTSDIKSEHLGKIIDIVATHTLSVPSSTKDSYWLNIVASDTMKHLVAGGVAGAVSRTVVSPMERMKILFQVQGPNMPAYTGVWSTLTRMWKEEGFKGFMRGNGTNVIRMIPYSASQFAAYEQFKTMLMKKGNTELDTPSRLLAGALAGTVSVACTYPLDLVRTRLSIQSATLVPTANTRLPGIRDTIKLIHATEGGLRGLYRGLWPTTLGVAPYVALNFQCYEVLKDYMIPVDSNHGNIRKLFCGALAGSIAQTIIYPLDVLRRRFQVSGMNTMDYKYNGTWHALTTMAKKEGFKSLYRGLLPNYLKVAPAMGVTFYSYELCKEFMHAK